MKWWADVMLREHFPPYLNNRKVVKLFRSVKNNATHVESSQIADCLHCDQGLLYGHSCNQKQY